MSPEPTLLCPQCHNKVTANDTFCGSCGHQLKAGEATAAPVAAPVHQDHPAVPPAPTPAPSSAPVVQPVAVPTPPVVPAVSGPVVDQGNSQKNGVATASMVIALAGLGTSLLSLFVPFYGFVLILMYITAVVLGIMGLKSQKRGRAIAGLIMGIIFALISIGLTLLYLLGVAVCKDPEKYGADPNDERCASVIEDVSSRVPSLVELIWDR